MLKNQHFTGKSKNPSSVSHPTPLESCTERLGVYRDHAKIFHVIWEQTMPSEKQDSWKRKLSVLNKHKYAVSTHKIHTNWILRCWENVLMDLPLPPIHYLNITNLCWQWKNCCLGRCSVCLTDTILRRRWKLWTL